MAKSREQLRLKLRERKMKHKDADKLLKLKKNWYPTTDAKKHYQRNVKTPKIPALRRDILPGQVLILLSGRFRGRRVVFLKQLPTGLLLVTGPYKLNGVPLKRVNQAYVIPTRTRVNLGGIPSVDKINDEFFIRIKVSREGPKDFFEDPQKKKERISEERKNAQDTVDTQVMKSVRDIPYMKEYMTNRFALKNGDKPHLMNF